MRVPFFTPRSEESDEDDSSSEDDASSEISASPISDDDSSSTAAEDASSDHEFTVAGSVPPSSPSPKPKHMSLAVNSALQSLPVEVLILIINQLDNTHTLRCLAATSRRLNDITAYRLWRTYYLLPSSPWDSIHRHLDTMLWHPQRVRHIRRLVIGPCDNWVWDARLVSSFERLWKLVPNLKHLVIRRRTNDQIEPTGEDMEDGAEVHPLLNTLISHGSGILLHTFKSSLLMIPDRYTRLYRWLESQTELRELYGVDLVPIQGIWHPPLHFLPQLKIIRSWTAELAGALGINGVRPLKSVLVRMAAETVHLAQFLEGYSTDFPRPLRSLYITLDDLHQFDSGPPGFLAEIATRLPMLEVLDFRGFPWREEYFPLIGELKNLVSLACGFHPEYVGGFPESALATVGDKLVEIVVWISPFSAARWVKVEYTDHIENLTKSRWERAEMMNGPLHRATEEHMWDHH